MKRIPRRNKAYYETVEDAKRKLNEASTVLKDISQKISRIKEQSAHAQGQGNPEV